MTNKVRIKMGPIEFEAEGDSELIGRERAQFFSLLPQAIMAVSPVVRQPSLLIDTTEVDGSAYESSENAPSLATSGQRSYSSVASFLNEKKFSTAVELVMSIGYYIECVENKGIFTSKDIENKLTEVRKRKPSSISQMFTQNIKKGFLRECAEKKDNLKAYSILDEGIKWYETYITTETGVKKKTSHAKTATPTSESALLAIPLNELNLDDYCDI